MTTSDLSELLILYEDSDLMVIDKPAGLVVNKSKTCKMPTLQDLVASKIDGSTPQLSKDTSTKPTGVGDDFALYPSEFTSRGGIVHRLDKETSGVIIVAKNQKAFTYLQRQFKERKVVKSYIALVIGELPDAQADIRLPIIRDPRSRTKFAVSKDGREAESLVKKIKVIEVLGEKLTLVRVFPKTGRTHQIRVHLTALGFPIVGDIVYASRKQNTKWLAVFGRMMLHAEQIEFTDTGGKVCHISSEYRFSL